MKAKTKLMLLFSCIPFLTFGQDDCIKPSNTLNVQWNNLNITLAQGGNFFDHEIDFLSTDPPNPTFSFSSGLCLSTIHEGGYKTAISNHLHPQLGTDFWTGPLNSSANPILRGRAYGEEYCQNFDQFWTVDMEEVLAHIDDWNDDGTINNDVPDNILAWPGRENPQFEDVYGWVLPEESLAPFVDRNDNGIYEPMLGDFPAIKGTWNAWKMINDAGNIHTESNGDKIRVQLSVMYYAFATDNEAISNTIYTDIELKNQSSTYMDSLVVSLFSDYKNGFRSSFGSNPEKNYSFYYVKDEPEMLNTDSALVIQKVLLSDPEVEEQFSNFTYSLNPGEGNPPSTLLDPMSVIEYTRLLNGEWRDGTPLSFGGNGYGGQEITKYAFPDNPNDPTGWSMCNEDLPMGYDYRTYTSSLIGNALPGSVRRFSYSFTFIPEYGIGCPDFVDMDEIGDEVEDIWSLNYSTLTSLVDFSLDNKLKIYPNPTQRKLTLSIDNQQIESIEIYSTTGLSVLRQENFNAASVIIELPASMVSGLYFVKAKTENGEDYIQKIMKQ